MAMDAAKEVDPQKGFTVYSYATEPVPEGSLRIAYDLSFLPPSCIRCVPKHLLATVPAPRRIWPILGLAPNVSKSGWPAFPLKLNIPALSCRLSVDWEVHTPFYLKRAIRRQHEPSCGEA